MHCFTLRCQLPTDDADPKDCVDSLAVNGCTDATLGVGQRGRIALAFARQAMSYADAVSSAIDDVTHAIPGLRRVEMIEEGEP